MRTAVLCAASAAIGTKIYDVSGINSAETILNTNQIYDTAPNKSSKGASMPTTPWCGAGASSGGIWVNPGQR